MEWIFQKHPKIREELFDLSTSQKIYDRCSFKQAQILSDISDALPEDEEKKLSQPQWEAMVVLFDNDYASDWENFKIADAKEWLSNRYPRIDRQLLKLKFFFACIPYHGGHYKLGQLYEFIGKAIHLEPDHQVTLLSFLFQENRGNYFSSKNLDVNIREMLYQIYQEGSVRPELDLEKIPIFQLPELPSYWYKHASISKFLALYLVEYFGPDVAKRALIARILADKPEGGNPTQAELEATLNVIKGWDIRKFYHALTVFRETSKIGKLLFSPQYLPLLKMAIYLEHRDWAVQVASREVDGYDPTSPLPKIFWG